MKKKLVLNRETLSRIDLRATHGGTFGGSDTTSMATGIGCGWMPTDPNFTTTDKAFMD